MRAAKTLAARMLHGHDAALADGCSKSTFCNKRKLNEIADFTTTDIGITLTTNNDHRCM